MRLRAASPGVVPGTLVGGYTVERKLGAGGYGTVYLARLEGQPYALKFLSLESVGRWWEREVAILLRLQHLAHPNVVRMLSHTLWPVAAPEHLVIVMGYVPGTSLDAWARERNPSAREVARTVLDVARALATVHAEGVVHRDVKGSNVLVHAEDGRAVLADFGVGGYEGAPGLTLHVLPPGTPEYRAPEAWRFERDNVGRRGARYVAGPADDLWALGVTLYWLLTDHHPFEAGDDASVVDAILHHAPRAPHAVNPRVPAALSRECLRLLEKRPEARHPGAEALGVALAEALAGADAAWDVPLCDFHDAHTATTEGRNENILAWANAPDLPRRGPRPGKPAEARPWEGEEAVTSEEAPGRGPPAVPEAEGAYPPDARAGAGPGAATTLPLKPAPERHEMSATPSEGAAEPSRRARARHGRAWRVLMVAVLALAVAGGWWAARRDGAGPASLHVVPDVWSVYPTFQEVAPLQGASEAARAAAPPSAEATHAVAARSAVPPEKGVPVKKSQPSVSPVVQQARRTAAVAGLCMGLACSGPQVRPPPEPADCPEKSLRVMEGLGIDLGEELSAQLPGSAGTGTFVNVQQGNVKVRLVEGYSDSFRGGTMLSCYLTLSDRVYGRCPAAQTRDGTKYPVCFELLDTGGNLGLEREGGGGGDSARVLSVLLVRAVSSYE